VFCKLDRLLDGDIARTANGLIVDARVPMATGVDSPADNSAVGHRSADAGGGTAYHSELARWHKVYPLGFLRRPARTAAPVGNGTFRSPRRATPCLTASMIAFAVDGNAGLAAAQQRTLRQSGS